MKEWNGAQARSKMAAGSSATKIYFINEMNEINFSKRMRSSRGIALALVSFLPSLLANEGNEIALRAAAFLILLGIH